MTTREEMKAAFERPGENLPDAYYSLFDRLFKHFEAFRVAETTGGSPIQMLRNYVAGVFSDDLSLAAFVASSVFTAIDDNFFGVALELRLFSAQEY
jgi:hypothetical protein